MRYTINKSDEEPIYIQLYKQIKADIINGVYQYKSKLPSKRLTAEELGISIISVEHAFELLCDEGYAESKERSGYFVTYNTDEFFLGAKEKNNANRSSENIVSNDDTHIDLPFSSFAKTMRRVLSEKGEKILVKSPNKGCFELQKAVSDYLKRFRGINVLPERIIIGSGAEYLYGIALRVLGNDRVYGLEYPSYEKIQQIYESNGAKFDFLSLSSDGIDSAELRRTNATVLHITPYRSFPSGITASASKRHEYIRWAKERQGYIIEDDFDSEFTVSSKPEETVFAIEKNENVIYMNTFSRTIAPSIRAGYMILPEHLYSEFEKKAGFYSCTVPTFEQFVLAEFIANGDFERHINKIRRAKRLSKSV